MTTSLPTECIDHHIGEYWMVNPLYLSRQYRCGVLFRQQNKGNNLNPKKAIEIWLVQRADILRRNYVASAVKHTTNHRSGVATISDLAPTVTPERSPQSVSHSI